MSEENSRPLLVVDKTPTAVGILTAFALLVLWAFSTLNATTEERSIRNERDIQNVYKRIDEKFGKINATLIEISGKLGKGS